MSADFVPLGVLEEHVLIAVFRTGDEAYGMQVRREIETQFGIKVLIARTEFGGLSADFQSEDLSEHTTLQNELQSVSRKLKRSRHSHK